MNPDYVRNHQNRANLLIHIVAVPLFVLGLTGAVVFAATGRLLFAAALLPLPVISLAVQGAGHKREDVPPDPFTGPLNFVGRILVEQFFKFPLFVASGECSRALKNTED